MRTCRMCKAEALSTLLDAGMHPISNRYLGLTTEKEDLFPIILGQCDKCGLVQFVKSVPVKALQPTYEWITYSEPEGHLNQLTDIITTLPGITKKSVIGGISYKEDSTLARIKQRGFTNTWRIDPKSDLGIKLPTAGIETIQDLFRPTVADRLVRKHGTSDVVIARHILEHAYEPRRFVTSLKRMVKPGGFIVFEVPGCTKLFETFDYSGIWEEHIFYFTPDTFSSSLGVLGFSVERFEIYPYPYEDSLVGIVQLATSENQNCISETALKKERDIARAYAKGVAPKRQRLKRFLSEYRHTQGKIAMFGAGHVATMFINLMQLKEEIEFIVDDSPNKNGLFMPGSRLPIHDSKALMKAKIKLCLMSLSPESEEKVIQKKRAFISNGGKFSSILPASKYALRF